MKTRVRVALVLLVALAVGVAVPRADLLDALPGGWPLPSASTVRDWLGWPGSDRPAPGLPKQASGSAAGTPGSTGSDATRAGGGAGHEPGHGIGALPAETVARPDRTPTTTGTAPEEAHFDPATSVRLPEEATETQDVYANADGSYTRKLSQAPINYRAADGSMQPIDTTVRAQEDERWSAPATTLAPRLAASADDPALVSVRTAEGTALSYGLRGARTAVGVVQGSTVTYPQVLDGTDLRITVGASWTREELILGSPAAGNSWLFPLALHGLTPRLSADGAVELVAADGRVHLVMPRGVMRDSSTGAAPAGPAESDAVVYALETLADGSWAVRVTADAGWLADPARAYPVTVDPDLWDRIRSNGTTYVTDGYTADHSSTLRMKVGTDPSIGKESRMLIKFDAFQPTFHNAKVYEGHIKLFNIWAQSCDARDVRAFAITGAWSPSTTRTYPGPSLSDPIGNATHASTVACKNTSLDGDTGEYIDIKINDANLLTWWARQPEYNGGIAITAPNTSSVAYRMFCGALCTESPAMDVTYRPNEAPQIVNQSPAFGAAVSTLTPQLLVASTDDDLPGVGWGYRYVFTVFDKNGASIASSGELGEPVWTVPAGKLTWGESYTWRVGVTDGDMAGESAISPFTTPVPQPAVTSGLSQNGGQGFDAAAGNYTTSAVDAAVATVGPALAIQRSYNSLDNRAAGAFGTGWSSIADMRAWPATSSSGERNLVVIRYPTGQEVAFGLNPGQTTYTPPKGRFASLTGDQDHGYVLIDKDGTRYELTALDPTGAEGGGGTVPWWRVTSVTDAAGRTERFGHDAAGRLATVTSASGRTLTLTWTATTGGHVASVSTDPAEPGDGASALTWTYSYDGDLLAKVCPPSSGTHCTTYGYSDASLYRSAVLDTAPRSYWRLSDASGTAATSEVDSAEGTDNGTYTDVTLGLPGPLAGSPTTSAGFDGTSSRVELPTGLVSNGSYQTVSLWFKTTTPDRVLFSYQADPLTNGTTGGNYTPSLYVGTDGRLRGEFWYAGGCNPMVSPAAVTDGQWHQVVLTGGGDTQSMYLDGVAVGSRTGTVQMWAEQGSQHVYVGAGFIGGSWPDQSHSNTTDNTAVPAFFDGQISDVAFGGSLTTPDVVERLWAAGRTAGTVLSGITRPSGDAAARVVYDEATARVTRVTDVNGGVWQVGSPVVTGSSQVYVSSVLAPGPADYWRLGDAGGSRAINQVHGGVANFNEVTLGVGDGPFDDTTVASFNGTSSYLRLPDNDVPKTGPNTVTMWFKMPQGSTQGGVLFGYQSADITDVGAENWTPALYVGTDGKLYGKYWVSDFYQRIVSAPVNDGQWHHVALAGGSSNTVLYLDGMKVGQINLPMQADLGSQAYVGGGRWFSWPGTSGDTGWFPGSIAEVAFYRTQLTGAQVLTQAQARDKSHGTPISTVTVTDPAGKTTSTVSDAAIGRKVAEVSAGGATTRYGYDTGGFLRTVTDANGNVTTTEHDVRGNTVSQTTCQDQQNNRCSTVYFTYFPDATSRTLTPDPRNDQILTQRDGRSASATDDTYRTSYTLDAHGSRTAVEDPLHRRTTTTYTDGSTVAAADGGFAPPGLPATVTTPGGATQTVTYFRNGDVASVTDPTGKVTSHTYDGLGRALTTTETTSTFPAGLTTTVTYDRLGNVVTRTAPAVTDRVTGAVHTAVTTIAYNADGQPLGQTVADATGGDAPRTVSTTYNSHGQADTTTDATGAVTSYEYDAFGRVKRQTDPDGQTVATTYTADGALYTTTLEDWTGDPNDPGDPRSVPMSARTYDPAGRLASVTDAMGWVTSYTYTDNNLPVTTTRTDPATGASFVQERTGYDAAGNVVSRTSNDGATRVTYEVDAAGRTSEQTLDPGGFAVASVSPQIYDPDALWRTTAYEYTADDHVAVTTVSDDGGVVSRTEASYDALGRATSRSVVLADGSALTTSWTLDEGGLALSMTDPKQAVTTYGYDEAGRLVTTVAPAVEVAVAGAGTVTAHPVATVGYNTFGEEVESTDANGNTTTVVRDAAGRPTSTRAPPYTPVGASEPITAVTSTTYTASGKVKSTTDAVGRTTSYTYDQLDRVASTTAPDGGVTRFTYDLLGDQLTITDPTGAVTAKTYDHLGRVLTSSQAVRQDDATYTTNYTYGPGGWLASTTSPAGVVNSATHNAAGETVTATDGAGNTTRVAYDAAGRAVRTTLPDGTFSTVTYDRAGRATATADFAADGTQLRSQSSTFDELGNPLAVTDARGNATTFTYDALGRLATQVEPVSASESITSSFGYDLVGNATRFTNGRGETFWTTYTPWNLPESQIEPSTTAHPAAGDRTFSVAYDADGRLAASLLPGGVSVTTSYDDGGRLARMTGTGAEVSTSDRVFGYDLAGRMTSVSGTGGTNTFSYDDRDLLRSTSGPSGSSSFGYDPDGGLTSRQDAAGTTSYTYDAAGRLATVANATTGVGVTYGYNQLSQVTTMTLGAGAGVRSLGYDGLHRLTSDEVTLAGGASVGKIVYGWDANDNLTSKTTTGFGGAGTTIANTYTYDFADRLTSWNNGVTTTEYGYDAAGNRVRAGSATATYDERNRLVTADGTTYRYTPRGTLSATVTAAGTLTTKTDAFGQITSQDATPGQPHTYTYDGLGRLTGPGLAYTGITNTLAGDGQATYTRDPAGSVLGTATADTKTLVWTDHHSDIVGQLSAAGTAMAGSRVYDPWGTVLSQAGMLGNLGFQSAWTDAGTGRVNMRARWYNPATGAFDTRDAASNSPQGDSVSANRYAYADANPLTNVDPGGTWSLRSIAKSVTKAATAVAHTVVAVARAVYTNVIAPVVSAVVNVVKAVVNTVVSAVKSAVNYVRSAASKALSWAAQKAAAARAWVAQKAAAAKQKAAAALTYAKTQAKEAAAKAQRAYTEARQKVADAYHAGTAWVAEHKDLLIEIAAIGAGIVAGLACAAVTGPGAIACMAGTMALINLAKDAAQGNIHSIGDALMSAGTGALQGLAGAAGGAIGGRVAALAANKLGSFAATLGGRVLVGAVSGGAGDAAGQFLATGEVDWSGVALSATIGGVSGGRARGGGRSGVHGDVPSRRATHGAASEVDAPTPHRGDGRVDTDSSEVGGSCPLPGHSFDPNTRVVMADGSTKKIKDIRVGDKVKATDPASGATGARTVTLLHRNRDTDLTDVTVTTGGAATTVIATTAHHPFWDATTGQWVHAGNLTPGHQLRTDTGDTDTGDTDTGDNVTVVAVTNRDATAVGGQAMDDLTIADIHTYYVLAGNTPVLVHNCKKGSAGGVDIVETDGCTHVCLGVNPHSDDLAKAVGAHTFNGGQWGGTETTSGDPLWMEGVRSVTRSGHIKLSVTLDGLFGADGDTLAHSAQEAFDVNYARGRAMNEIEGRKTGNQTAWELGQVGASVRFGRREWNSIDWYWQKSKVDLANPFGE